MTWNEVKAIYGVRSWRKISGYENYRVTSDGRVWSCLKEKFVRFDYNLNSYLRVELWRDGLRTWFFAHRLVAVAYKKNPDPKNKKEVNHMDYNIHNNASANLEWVTRSENVMHSKRKTNSSLVYRGRGRWKKLTYEETKALAGTPF